MNRNPDADALERLSLFVKALSEFIQHKAEQEKKQQQIGT